MRRTIEAVLVASTFLTTLTFSSSAQEFTRTEIGIDTSILHPSRPLLPDCAAAFAGAA
jgi:hypothetical protein